MERAVLYALERLNCSNFVLKPEQKRCITSVLGGKEVFMWLPTGFGKTICYEILPFAFDKHRPRGKEPSLIIVVSPLVSLIVDQVRSLRVV